MLGSYHIEEDIVVGAVLVGMDSIPARVEDTVEYSGF